MTDLLKAPEVAAIFGVNIATINRWCIEGKIPAVRHGHHWYMQRANVEAMFVPTNVAG